MLTWKAIEPGAVLYDEFRPGVQELALTGYGAMRLTESDGRWELTEYERRSGAGYRALAISRFSSREAAIRRAEEVVAAAGGMAPGADPGATAGGDAN